MSNVDVMAIANSLAMWSVAGLAIAMVLVQAIVFAHKSYQTGLQIGLERSQMNSGIRSAVITSIGPSIVILTGLFALLVVVGGPMSWMRLSFIGSVQFELMAAKFGAEATGAVNGELTAIGFANSVWTMTLGALGWILVSTIFADKMERVQSVVSGGRAELFPIIGIAAMLGSFGALCVRYIDFTGKVTPDMVALLSGALLMVAMLVISKKYGKRWLQEWALGIAIFGGMLCAVAVR